MSKHEQILNLFNMAEGFLQSSLQLASVCLRDNDDKKSDILIFPILANANHGVELYLKGFIWALNQLNQLEVRIEGRHNIKQIFQTVRSKVRDFKGSEGVTHFDSEMTELSSYLTELFSKIKATPKNDKMDFTRYPFGRDKENHFYVEEFKNEEVDLENFIHRFEMIREKLECYGDYLYYHEINGDQ
jgi:hypothetical protein